MEFVFGDGVSKGSGVTTESDHIKIFPDNRDKIILILGTNRVVIERRDNWTITRSANVEVETLPAAEPATLVPPGLDVMGWVAGDRKKR